MSFLLTGNGTPPSRIYSAPAFRESNSSSQPPTNPPSTNCHWQPTRENSNNHCAHRTMHSPIRGYARCAGHMLFHLILMFGMLVRFLLSGSIQLIDMSLAWIEGQDTKHVLLLEWQPTPEFTLPLTRHPLLFTMAFADSKWLWDFNINRSLLRIKGKEIKPMLFLEWHTTPEHTLSIVTVENPSIILPLTRHALFFTQAFTNSKWLGDFDNTLFRSLFFRKCIEMQVARMLAKKPGFLINYGKTSMATVQIRETTTELSGGHSDSDEYFDLEFDIFDQETDVGTMDRQFVIVAPEVNDEESSTQLVFFTPQVERDEPTVDVTPETEQSNTIRLPDPSTVELGFVLLRIRSTTCELNAAPETLDVESTYELFYHSTLNISDIPSIRAHYYVYGYTFEPVVPASPIPPTLAVHNVVGTGLGPRVTYPSSEVKAKNYWNSLGDADRAYYLRHVRLYDTCHGDYLAQKQEWERILTYYPWTPQMQTFFPLWKYCEPVFAQFSPAFCQNLDISRQVQLFHRVRESESALKMCEKWIVEHIMPEIKTMLDWDVQHGEWKTDVEDAKAAAVTQDEELGKIWMAAKAKKDAREGAGWPVAQTAQLQTILDQENAEVEMKENEIRRWWKPATRVISITVEDDDALNSLTVAHWTPRFKVLDPEVASDHCFSQFVPGKDFTPVFRKLWHFEMPETDMMTREMMVHNGQVARPMRTSPEDMRRIRQMVNEPYKDAIDSLLGITFDQFSWLCATTPMEDLSGCICDRSTCEQCYPTAPNDTPPIRLEAWEISEQTAERERAYMLRNGSTMNGTKRNIANVIERIAEEAKKRPQYRNLNEMVNIQLRRDARRQQRANRPIVVPFYKPFEPAGKSLTEIAFKAYCIVILRELDMLPDAPPLLLKDLGLCRYPTTPQTDEAASLDSKLRGLKPKTKDDPEGLPFGPLAIKRKSHEISEDPELRETVPFHDRVIKKVHRRLVPVTIAGPQKGVKRSIENVHTYEEAPSKIRRTRRQQEGDDSTFSFAYKRFWPDSSSEDDFDL
ncbi:hypothetical protein HBH53_084070 [Parastagonospora nodorum]|nr:hypothetical protein HBH53_084070 [Parastagonospora nodorum]